MPYKPHLRSQNLRRCWAKADALIVVVTLLAGCSSGPPAPEPEEEDGAPPRIGPGTQQAGHIHDLWGGVRSMVLMDAPVKVTVVHNHLFDEPPRPEHLHNCAEQLASTSQGGSVTFTLPAGTVVPPGTARLVVRFDWSDASISALRFFYQPPSNGHADNHAGHDHANMTDAGPIKKNEPITLELTHAMADLGHDYQSHWAFYLCADPAEEGVSQGAINMNVTAERTEVLQADPPHPDLWGNATRIELATYHWQGQTWSGANQGADAWHHLLLGHDAIVPPGTSQVEVTAWLNRTPGATDPLPVDVLLYYKDSKQVDWIYKSVRADASAGGVWRFSVLVDDPETLDGPYATLSNWHFWLRIVSPLRATAPAGLGTHGVPLLADASLDARVDAL